MPQSDFRQALDQIERDLVTKIQSLRRTRQRLKTLDAGHLQTLPVEVAEHLRRLPELGFSRRWVAMETDLWILVFATHPDTGLVLFHDQAEALADPALRRIYLSYDRAHDLDPDDPRLAALARRIVAATRRRYGDTDFPGQDTDTEIPGLVKDAVNASSPAWQGLDTLIRTALNS